MIKDMAWHFFKKTGNISTFLEYKDLEQNNEEYNVNNEKLGDLFGNNKDKGNSNKPLQF